MREYIFKPSRNELDKFPPGAPTRHQNATCRDRPKSRRRYPTELVKGVARPCSRGLCGSWIILLGPRLPQGPGRLDQKYPDAAQQRDHRAGDACPSAPGKFTGASEPLISTGSGQQYDREHGEWCGSQPRTGRIVFWSRYRQRQEGDAHLGWIAQSKVVHELSRRGRCAVCYSADAPRGSCLRAGDASFL
jgi:hypothetical protein